MEQTDFFQGARQIKVWVSNFDQVAYPIGESEENHHACRYITQNRPLGKKGDPDDRKGRRKEQLYFAIAEAE